ncbi:MAG: hypothetical protein AAF206_22215 [Bacteroidota bacterium]
MERIDLSQRRDFGDLFSTTFKYVIDNAGSLLKAVILYAGPIYLMQGILTSLAFGKMLKQLSSGAFTPSSVSDLQEMYLDMFSNIPLWAIPAMIITAVAGYLMLVGLVNNHLDLYARGEDHENMDLLRTEAVQSMWPNLALSLIMGLMVLGAYLAVALLIGLGVLVESVAISVIFGIIGFIGLIYMIVAVYPSFMVREHEQLGAIDSIRRSFQMIKGHWWQTFFLTILISILGGILSSIISGIIGAMDHAQVSEDACGSRKLCDSWNTCTRGLRR